MKFTCNTSDLAAAVAAARRAANPNSTVPVLANVLISVNEDDEVIISGMDLEITIQKKFNATMTETGRATVNARLFSEYLNNIGAQTVTIIGTQKSIIVEAEHCKCEFLTISAEEYPSIIASQEDVFLEIESEEIREAINTTIYAASKDEARGTMLMGTLLETKGEIIELTATDGYRLAHWNGILKIGTKNDLKIVIPSRILNEVSRLTAKNEKIKIIIDENKIIFLSNQTIIIGVLTQGNYPNVSQIIPENVNQSINIDKTQIIGALKRAEMVAGNQGSQVIFGIKNSILSIAANSDPGGRAYEEMDIQQMGSDIEIAFNARYLIEILEHINGNSVKFEFNGPTAAAIIRETSHSKEYFSLLMPLRR